MPLFLFHGEDTYSLRQKVNFWKEEFLKKHGDVNLEVLEGKDLEPDQFLVNVTSVPFLSEKRLMVVKNIFSHSPEANKKIAEALESIPDFSIVLFTEEIAIDKRTTLYKRLEKLGTITEFPPLTGSKLLSWIFGKCKDMGAEINEEAAIYLSELVGGDLYRLENELIKVGHHASGGIITKKEIELLVNTTLDTSIFQLTDALATKNLKRSISLLHQLLESGDELGHILHMVVRQFRIIIQAKELSLQGLRKSAIVPKIKEHPYAVGIAVMQSANFSMDQLKEIYRTLLEIDTKLKTGGIKTLAGDSREFTLAMDKLVAEVCGG